MATPPQPREVVYRHALITRVTHWINVLCLFVLLLSGFQIFNAHPMLYWGADGTYGHQWWLRLQNGFPGWATIPSWRDLAAGRLWHFFFAWLFVLNGLVYLLHGVLSGHFRRDFVPTREQWRGIGRTAFDHVRLRFPRGEEARVYNVLQKISYIGVVVVLPLMLLTGLGMSPAIDAVFPLLLDVFGGRQSARSIHFICAWLLVGFTVIHLLAILAAGPVNEIRSMITGRYAIRPAKEERP